MSLDNLPAEWRELTLGDISEVKTGKTPSKKEKRYWDEKEVPWLTSSATGQEKCFKAEQFISNIAAKECNLNPFPKGSLLLAMYGEGKTRGQVTELMFDATCNQACAVIHVNSNITSNRFVQYKLKENYHRTRAVAVGGAQPNLNLNKVREIKVVLPPLAEQQEIIRQLDVMLTQVEQIKACLDAIPAILKKFRQSVLADAVSGKLTEDWRKENPSRDPAETFLKAEKILKDNYLALNPNLKKKKSSLECQIDQEYLFDIPSCWAFTSWGKISEWITYGFTKPMPKSESGKKLLTAKDVQNFCINIDDANFTTEEAYSSLSEKDKPQKGDLLITKDGTIGRSGLIRADIPFCINQSVAVCWLRSTSMNKDYLEYLVNSEFTQKFVFDKAQGMAIQHLSIIDFAKCPVPVPPKEEQDVIVNKLNTLYKKSESIESLVYSAQKRVNLLTQSILAKAFSGELTAEWREQHQELITGINSAESLLAKIQAEREVSKPVKKTRAKKEV